MTNLLYTFNTNSSTLTSGSVIPLGSVGRKAGTALNLNGNGISVSQNGYYEINATFTVLPSVSEAVTIQLYEDGVAIQGAKATVTTDAVTTIPLTTIIRKYCCHTTANITAVLTTSLDSTTVDVSASSVAVIKL